MNAANILKPALSRGEIQVIGATTFNEYRKYIEKDQALERRFQPVRVEEPTVADTLAVLKGIKHYYEEHHHVQVPADRADRAAVTLTRTVHHRPLPARQGHRPAGRGLRLLQSGQPGHLGVPRTCRRSWTPSGRKKPRWRTPTSTSPSTMSGWPSGKTRLAQLESELPAKQAAASAIQVTMDDVAKVIELWTGIPAVKIRENELRQARQPGRAN